MEGHHPLAIRIVAAELRESQGRLAQAAIDPSIPWEEVSRMAGQDNLRILQLMDDADAFADRFVEENTDEAIATGVRMFSKAAPTVDPDFIPDLAEGVNALVARVREQASLGTILPINYMDPRTRKQLFLVESYMKAARGRTPSGNGSGCEPF